MGIKSFFSWFKTNFGSSISTDEKINVDIDNLMIDMNGLFHSSTQKIYEYGSYAPLKSLLVKLKKKEKNPIQQQNRVFEDICQNIDKIVDKIQPKKRLILCVDGPAPLSKQNQQRQRRFLSSLDSDDKESDKKFDSNCLTPGTLFMDNLTKYIDWFIKKRMSEKNTIYSKIEIIFSNEKVPGEGEHGLISFIRKHKKYEESYCITGMDADLIMLALGTHMPKFYILREEPLSTNFDFYFINIGQVYKDLINLLRSDFPSFSEKYAIHDFIFMCFTVGNDFLPNIPAIEILSGGIDFMIDVYKKNCIDKGHLTYISEGSVFFSKDALSSFFLTISNFEEIVLSNKINDKKYFPDEILHKNWKFSGDKFSLDILNYRKDYYDKKFEINSENYDSIQKICHEYLKGMQWVINYYLNGVPDWKWKYPYHYAPFSFDLAKFVNSYIFSNFTISSPILPFIQLLSVLPPSSSKLLPSPLNSILEKGSFRQKFCPEKFIIDYAGKKNNWEATVILPMIDYNTVEKLYFDLYPKVEEKDKKRNIIGKSQLYKKTDEYFLLKSFYGNFNCCVKTTFIDI